MKEKRYNTNPLVIKRKIAGQIILIPQKKLLKIPKENSIYILNKVSGLIWDLFSQKKTISQIVTVLVQRFKDVDRKEIESDILEILREWKKKKLILAK